VRQALSLWLSLFPCSRDGAAVSCWRCSYNGGGVHIASGDAVTSAGAVSIAVGLSTTGTPGQLSLSGGQTNGVGAVAGSVNIWGGNAPAGTGDGISCARVCCCCSGGSLSRHLLPSCAMTMS
jgi:hypothetical protein